MTVSHAPVPNAENRRSGLAYNLCGIALLVLLVAVGFAYAIDQAGRNAGPPAPQLGDADRVTQTVAGHELTIPASWFRFGDDVRAGFVSQVDLSFSLSLDPGQKSHSVDATLLPRSGARASSALLDAVYLHQFADETVGGVPGLVGKPLKAGEGYADETVWYDPLSPNPFVAKCSRSPSPSGPDRCLRTMHLPDGLAVVLRFDAGALAGWKRFDEELALWLGQIGAI